MFHQRSNKKTPPNPTTPELEELDDSESEEESPLLSDPEEINESETEEEINESEPDTEPDTDAEQNRPNKHVKPGKSNKPGKSGKPGKQKIFADVSDHSDADADTDADTVADDDIEELEPDPEDEEELEPEPEQESAVAESTQDEPIKNSTEVIIVVPNDKRRTSHIMSLSEFTEAISLRTEQISADGMQGAMIDELPAGVTSARDIAIAEIRARRCPLKLCRNVGRTIDAGVIKNYVEIWSPNVMTHPPFQ